MKTLLTLIVLVNLAQAAPPSLCRLTASPGCSTEDLQAIIGSNATCPDLACPNVQVPACPSLSCPPAQVTCTVTPKIQTCRSCKSRRHGPTTCRHCVVTVETVQP